MSPREEEEVRRPGTSSQGDSQRAPNHVRVDSLPLIFQHVDGYFGSSKTNGKLKCEFCKKNISYSAISYYNLKSHNERYLRSDDSSHQIRLALGDSRVLQTDLIPLLREHNDDTALLNLVLRLLVNLTSPALLVFHQEVPEDKAGRQVYLKLVSQQQSFKEAFTEAPVWASLAGILASALQQEGERDDDTNMLVEMCLVLLRNVLAVAPGRQDSTRTHDDADLHDQVLWSIHLAAVPDLLLYLSTCQQESELALHTLEIISLMLRQQDPQILATSALHRSTEEKKKDDNELQRLRDAERLRRQQQVRKHYNSRHSRFGGTYYVHNLKSISDRDIIAHQPVVDINQIDFDKTKRGKKIPRNRAPLQDVTTTRRSTLAIRLFLQEFCVEFLNGAYNNLLNIVKDNLNRARAQEHDESYYLWAMKFFMEFNRHHEFKVELVSETLSIQTVHYIQTNIENYYEMMTTEKKKIPMWSRRMHNGLRAYQEILMTLATMDKSGDESVHALSLALKSKIFYVVEYRELPLVLLQNYDQVKMSKSYLKDVIETTHVFLKLLECMCKKTRHLMVQLPQKKKVTKKKKPPKQVTLALTPEKLEEMWSVLADDLSAVIQGENENLPVVVPFDPLSGDSEDEQKEKAMRRVNALLRKSELQEALALFRASREVWPEGDIFGAQDIDFSGEFSCLREVFMADLNPLVETTVVLPDEESEEENEEGDENVESSAHISERELDFSAFIRRFAHTKIMQSYSLLLNSYATNSSFTNRCIIKLFHRIAWDSKMQPIFFQSSLFLTFNKAMMDPAKKSNEVIGEIVKFGKYIVRQFFKVAETNPKVYMEILFWKTNKDALEIECGYDVPTSSKAMKTVWSEEEDDELARLYHEFKNKEGNSEDDKDIADLIMQNLIRQDRSRRIIIKRLKDMGLVENLRELNKKKPIRMKGCQWSETEQAELTVLFEEHKDAIDPLGRIMDFMIVPKSKHRIVEKLLELGLIADKSEVKKKRVTKPKAQKTRKTKNDGERFLAANNASDNESGDSVRDSDVTDSDEEMSKPSSSSKTKASTSNTVVPIITPYLISSALSKVLESGIRDSVTWLTELLTEVADDREQDGDFEPIPILAINDSQSLALDNGDFQSLMKIIGVQPPQSHEEMFWRIPAKLTIEGLRKRALYLTQGLAGTLPTSPDHHTVGASSEHAQNRDDASQFTTSVSSFTTIMQAHSLDSNLQPIEEKKNDIVVSSIGNKTLRSLQNMPPNRQANKRGNDVFDDLIQTSVKSNKKQRRIIIDDSDSDDDNLPQFNTDNLVLQMDTEEFSENVSHSQSYNSVPSVTSHSHINVSSKDHFTDRDDVIKSTSANHVPNGIDVVDASHDQQSRSSVLKSSKAAINLPSDSDDSDVPIGRPRPMAIIDSDSDD